MEIIRFGLRMEKSNIKILIPEVQKREFMRVGMTTERKVMRGTTEWEKKTAFGFFLMKMVQFCIENHIFKVERLEIRNSGG